MLNLPLVDLPLRFVVSLDRAFLRVRLGLFLRMMIQMQMELALVTRVQCELFIGCPFIFDRILTKKEKLKIEDNYYMGNFSTVVI